MGGEGTSGVLNLYKTQTNEQKSPGPEKKFSVLLKKKSRSQTSPVSPFWMFCGPAAHSGLLGMEVWKQVGENPYKREKYSTK